MADEKYSVVFDIISKGGKPLILNAPPMGIGAGGSSIFAGGANQKQSKSEANAWAVAIGAAVISGLMKGFSISKKISIKKSVREKDLEKLVSQRSHEIKNLKKELGTQKHKIGELNYAYKQSKRAADVANEKLNAASGSELKERVSSDKLQRSANKETIREMQMQQMRAERKKEVMNLKFRDMGPSQEQIIKPTPEIVKTIRDMSDLPKPLIQKPSLVKKIQDIEISKQKINIEKSDSVKNLKRLKDEQRIREFQEQ